MTHNNHPSESKHEEEVHLTDINAMLSCLPNDILHKIAMYLFEDVYIHHQRQLRVHTAPISMSNQRMLEIAQTDEFISWGRGIIEYFKHSDTLLHTKDMRRKVISRLWQIINTLCKLLRSRRLSSELAQLAPWERVSLN